MNQKRVVAFGTFDLLHAGHLHYLSDAKKLGNYLIVVIARDETVKKVKGRLPVHDQEHRLEMVAALKTVDKAVLGCEHSEMFNCVASLRPDVVAMGYDQKPLVEEVKKGLSELNCFPEIVRLNPFREQLHKTTKIKERICKEK